MSLFNSETPEEKKDDVVPNPEVTPDKVTFKVGDREYDMESAATKITSADTFIETLKQEKRDMESRLEELQKQANGNSRLEEAIELLQKQHNSATETPRPETPTVDTNDMLEKLRKIAQEEALGTYQKSQLQSTKQENLRKSTALAKAKYGESFAEKLLERGTSLGLDQASIDAMASDNPEVFRALFVAVASSGAPSPSGSLNPQALGASQGFEKPVVGKHWDSKARVNALREAEATMVAAIKDGKYSI